MRLTQIKLSGFKSFVDPTHLQIPGQLVGVVGPNGCGKSNIIDAVRWVLGESKASELRGESMQDVIFNGSGQRKPAGRASVELVFDNSHAGGKPITGNWGRYSEIAVRRVLTRDGSSSYSINHQVVRRRDIQDIFLGTGLGPRAYAIIGQGMISRIIEARPEELRIFLEEAAGVSKYKERRRETENRLHDTRENMTRVDDILRELDANLGKLEAQAVVAGQYRSLQAERDEKQKLLWLLRGNAAKAEQEKYSAEVGKTQVLLESRTADLRRIEAEIETLRSAHGAAGEALHAAQGELYEAGASVNRLEAEIRVTAESRSRLLAQLAQLESQHAQWAAQADLHQKQLTAAEAERVNASEALRSAQAAHAERLAVLPAAEQHWRDAQHRLNACRAAVNEVQQGLQLEKAHQRNAERNLQALALRRERLEQERNAFSDPEPGQMERVRAQVIDLETRLEAAASELRRAELGTPKLRAERDAAQKIFSRESAQALKTEARLSSLRQLQQNVQTHGKLQPWLEKYGLSELPRLWQLLHVEAGWETALESVLRERISAIGISEVDGGEVDQLQTLFDDAPPAKLAFFSGLATAAATPVREAAENVEWATLVSLVRTNDASLLALLDDWIGDVYAAESVDMALQKRGALPPGAVFVVAAGHVIGRNSVRFYASDSEHAGMLARQQEIERLTAQQRTEAELADRAKSNAVLAEAALSEAASQLEKLRSVAASLTNSLHAGQLDLQRREQQQQQIQARRGRVESDLAEISTHVAHEEAVKAESQKRLVDLDRQLAEIQSEFDMLQTAFQTAQHELDARRGDLRKHEREVQEAQFTERNITSAINQLQDNVRVSCQQQENVAGALSTARHELANVSDSFAREALQDALSSRVAAENKLSAVRSEVDSLTAELRARDEARLGIEREIEPMRARIGELQLKEQAAHLGSEQFFEQLAEAGADLAALGEKLDSINASENDGKARPNTLQGALQGAMQSELNRLHQAIAALGAVNLAALDERATARERKTFLNAQQNDLTVAVTTLQDAIHKIDRETRGLLQDTFDLVNQHFGKLFPALFGGGEARLAMTGEEILDAGVQVLAQPPGKKNSTIHLLSGGEKALTAIALVFAMFQLNPAPFCLLDEVDAPLDDANTDRFCSLVKEMAVQTQFLFISHNKIAMEMAHQLIGVTMQEQGVSRIVAVDMEAAVGFARNSAQTSAENAAENVGAGYSQAMKAAA